VIVAIFEGLPDIPAHGNAAARRWREIIARLDETSEARLDPDLLILTRDISDYYLTPWGQCLRLILPGSSRDRPAPRYVLAETGQPTDTKAHRLSPSAREVLRRLADAPEGMTVSTLRRTIAGPVARILGTLKRRRLVRESLPDRPAMTHAPSKRRGPSGIATPEPTSVTGAAASEPTGPPLWLPSWWDRLLVALNQDRHEAFLLEVPTAARLPCVIHAAGQAIAKGRSALIVTPEIDRASTIAALAKTRWGERVHLLHSGRSAVARAEIWRQIRGGSASLVVGTRSAVFAPLSSMGLLCVEEEHDPALKEEQEPRYHAREVAWMRARQHQAVLVLGSAHPSLETVHAVSSAPSARSVQTSTDVARPPAPMIRLVDLRQVPVGTVLSEPMVAGIAAALRATPGQLGGMLFLNRKGFAPALSCRDCGESLRCPRCSVTLTFYRRAGRVTCPYCGASSALPETCPSCRAAGLQPAGFGTERLEEEVRRLFPDARVGRLDRDTARTPAQVEAVRRQVSAGQVDILIGTQLLLGAARLPAVRFVGIPYADAGLHLPDFRSAERTFQTLQEVITKAEPASAGGTVVLQTYLPTHHVMSAIATQHATTFYDEEMAVRRTLRFPPFSHLISLRVTGGNGDRVKAAAARWADRLRVPARDGSAESVRPGVRQVPGHTGDANAEVEILGPIQAPLARLRGRYRWQLLVKSTNAERGKQTVRATLDEFDRSHGQGGLKFEVDVDPVELV
jgi:primosomal protein N' (replication factor Y)